MLILVAILVAAPATSGTGWPTGHLQLALKGGAAFPSSELPGGIDVGCEVGLMLDAPFGRIGPVLTLSYAEPNVDNPAFKLSFPRGAAIVTAMALFDRFSRSGAPYLGVGAGPVLMHSHVSFAGFDRDRGEVRLGLGIVGGIAARFGPGSLLFELRLLHAPSGISDIHGVTPAQYSISVGYRVWLFG